MSHTKEPWNTEDSDTGNLYNQYADFIGKTFNPSDSIRIVACVNACAGIEHIPDVGFQFVLDLNNHRIGELEQRNAELVEALKLARIGLEYVGMQDVYIDHKHACHIIAEVEYILAEQQEAK